MRFWLLLVALGLAVGCRVGSRGNVKDSLHQSNVDFDYLGDDDDDDDSGGSGGNAFDATIDGGTPTTGAVAVSIGVQVNAIANSAQTNGQFTVTVTEPSAGDITTISTTALAGWSQTGWSHTSNSWMNTFTRASVSSGTTSPTFSFTPNAAGIYGVATSSGTTPRTTEATGGGNLRAITISGETFQAIGSASSPQSGSGVYTFPWNVAITATGGVQTNAEIVLVVRGNANGVATVALDGWSETGWFSPYSGSSSSSTSDPILMNVLTRTSVAAGTTNPQFSITVYGDYPDPFTLELSTNKDATGASYPPHTDQTPSGTGNSITVTVT